MHDLHSPPEASPEQDLSEAISAMMSDGVSRAQHLPDKMEETEPRAAEAVAQRVEPATLRGHPYLIGLASLALGFTLGVLACEAWPEPSFGTRLKKELRKRASAIPGLAE